MTAHEIVKSVLDEFSGNVCLRCAHAYVTDEDTYTHENYKSETLARLNLSVCCQRINAGHKRHCSSYTGKNGTCKKFAPATIIFIYPKRTVKMVHAGQWWTDLIKPDMKQIKNSLDWWTK